MRSHSAILTILCVIVCACGSRPTKETTEAVAALKKIQAGTQVGINYQEYGRLLIEAKAKVNDAIPTLTDGKLKDEINGAMDAYADAAHLWGIKINGHLIHPDDSASDKTIVDKYEIPLETSKYVGRNVDPEKGMQIVWLHADLHLKQVDILLGAK